MYVWLVYMLEQQDSERHSREYNTDTWLRCVRFRVEKILRLGNVLILREREVLTEQRTWTIAENMTLAICDQELIVKRDAKERNCITKIEKLTIFIVALVEITVLFGHVLSSPRINKRCFAISNSLGTVDETP